MHSEIHRKGSEKSRTTDVESNSVAKYLLYPLVPSLNNGDPLCLRLLSMAIIALYIGFKKVFKRYLKTTCQIVHLWFVTVI